MVSRTLAMAIGGLISGLLTKPWLMLTAPSSIHGPHVLGACMAFVAFAIGLSLGETVAHKLAPPTHQPDSDNARPGSSEASNSQSS